MKLKQEVIDKFKSDIDARRNAATLIGIGEHTFYRHIKNNLDEGRLLKPTALKHISAVLKTPIYNLTIN